MAGSIFERVYIDDRNKRWAVRIDEDKAGVTSAAFGTITADEDLDFLPVGHKMRGVNLVKTSGSGAGYVHAFLPCGTITSTLFVGTTKTITWNGATWAVTSSRGETRRVPKTINTGLVGASPTVGGGGGGGTT